MLACWRSRQAGRSTSPCDRVVDDARRRREDRQEFNLRLGVMGVMGAWQHSAEMESRYGQGNWN
jgi:hypothetical protein